MVVPTDPVAAFFQWHLRDTLGVDADLNLTEVWDDYLGRGVVIGIADDGIDYQHQDLAGAYRQDLDHDIVDNDDDAFASLASNAHGTAVAGMIAGAIDGAGSVGVAPGAEIAGVRLNTAQLFDVLIPHAQAALELLDGFDVATINWRVTSIFFRDNFLSSTLTGFAEAIRDAARDGRGGLGTVLTSSAGNEGDTGDNVNYHNLKNTPYGITVGAIDRNGELYTESTPGAAVLVSAPGDQVVTTDGRGNSGFVAGDYVQLSGTSFSAPAVAGVVALMLEANPTLGYRDVQEILAYSARNPLTSTTGWQENGADDWNGGGLQFHHGYGYGLVDAHAAVRLAETWSEQSTFANRQSATQAAIVNQAVPDPGSISDSITISGMDLELDWVEVGVSIAHPFIGDLSVTLTSPAGTTSTLVNRPGRTATNPFGSNLDNIVFTLSSAHFWGEAFDGTWQITVTDADGTFAGLFAGWALTGHGDSASDDDVYVYTDEYARHLTTARATLSDAGGTDTINAAAVTTDNNIDLSPDAVGSNVIIPTGTTIENLIAGDGNDTLAGNAVANVLNGGRGSDQMSGRGGDDTLKGGDGSDTMSGDAGNDRLEGEAGDDTLDGGAGHDNLLGAVGDDDLSGGDGADTLSAGAGDDVLRGGDGPDQLLGGAGTDTLIGGDGTDDAGYGASATGVTANLTTGTGTGGDANGDTYSGIEDLSGSAHADSLTGDADANVLVGAGGNDFIDGAAGDDYLVGGAGDDMLHGRDGNDILSGSAGADQLFGEAGNDDLAGNGGDDILDGGAGDDSLVGDGLRAHRRGIGGADTLYGGDGNDQLTGGVGGDILDGGDGLDTARYDDSTAGVTVNLSTGTAAGGYAAGDSLANIENLTGSDFQDTLTGDLSANTIAGGAGDDGLWGLAGDDLFIFADGSGSDTVHDFTTGSGSDDVLDIAAFGFTDLVALIAAASQMGSDTVIALDSDDQLTLTGVDRFSLHADDFLFA